MNELAVSNIVRHEIAELPRELRQPARAIWEEVAKVDKQSHLSATTSLFGASLRAPRPVPLRTGVGHFYMWMAYTLYDRLLDGDGSVLLLPTANVLQRAALSNTQLDEAFLKMDTANLWELSHTRAQVVDGQLAIEALPDYGAGRILAERAYGHIASCLELVVPPAQKEVEKALCDYVIARQLNDDLHDWVADISRGHLSYVVSFMLETLKIKVGRYNLATVVGQMKVIFWQESLEQLCQQVIARIEAARQRLAPFLVLQSQFDQLILEPVHRVAEQALQRHRQNHALLNSHRHGV